MPRPWGCPAPSSAWLGLPGLQGCGQGPRPSGWPLIKRGLGWEPGGQPRPWAFLWGRSQPWRSEKGAGGHPSLEPMGVSSRDCLDSGTASPCPPVSLCRRTDKDPGQHPCPWCPTSFLFSSRIRAPPAHMRSEVRAGLQGPVHHPPVPRAQPGEVTCQSGPAALWSCN